MKGYLKREFKYPWREAGPPNLLDDQVDLDQQVVNKELSLKAVTRGAAFCFESWGKSSDKARHKFIREVFAILDLGAGTSRVWRQRFGFGPGTRTSRSSFFTASPLAMSRGVFPNCPANQGPVISVLPTRTHEPPTLRDPLR